MLSDFGFGLKTTSNQGVSSRFGWTLVVLNRTGAMLATYSLSGPTAGNWTRGGSTLAEAPQVISMMTTPTGVSGDTFVWSIRAVGPCSNGWITTTAIP